MSLKLKLLSLGVLATLAVGAMSVMSASATTGGHFTFEQDTVTLTGKDIGKPHFFDPVLNTKVTCNKASYHGHVTTPATGQPEATTLKSVTITPTYEECSAAGLGAATVTMNGCAYIFTIGVSATEDNTVHLECPTHGGVQTKVELHIAGPFGTCTVTIKAQTPKGGVSFHTGTTEGGPGNTNKHDITATITVTGIHAEWHGGAFKCGRSETKTDEVSELTGEATVWGEDPVTGHKVGITATGSNGKEEGPA